MTSSERQKRPTAPRKPVEREKSLSLDDVFAKSFLKDAYGASNRHRAPKESRSLCGDRTTTKKATSRSALKPRNGGDDDADESGNETDTGHSVATTGHRSQRRVSKLNRSAALTSSPNIKRSKATAAAQVLTGLYSTPNPNDDTESEESSRKSGDKAPVKRSQASSTKSSAKSRPELSKVRSRRRNASDTPKSGADEAPVTRGATRVKPGSSAIAGSVRSSRDRPENARAKSSMHLTSGKPDRTLTAERKVQIHPDSGGDSNRVPRSPSKARREKERSERHLGDRPKPNSERLLKERCKSERHMKDREPSERRLRERSKSRTRVPTTPKPGESTPRASRGTTASRDGPPRQSSTIPADQRSRSSRRRGDTDENPATPEDMSSGKRKGGPSYQSPQPMLSSSSSKSKTLEKTPSKQSEKRSKPKSTMNVGNASGNRLNDSKTDSKVSPAKDRRKTESTEGTATATEDALSSDDSSNCDDAQGSRSVLQFDPSQQGDNAVYRVQQVPSTLPRTLSGEGQIAALVDPLGAAQQLDQPRGHAKDNPIFQFLESTDFDYFPASTPATLDGPSGDEASEDDELVDSPGSNDLKQSFGGGVVPDPSEAIFPGLADELGRDESQFGYSGDGTFVDDNNPYGYNVEETFESQGGPSRAPAVFGPSHDSYDEGAYLYDDDDVGTGSFSNPYGIGTVEPMITARQSFGDDGSQLYETDSVSHYDQQSTLHDSFMPQSGAPQFNPSTFGGTEPFFVSTDAADDASFDGAWEAAKADPIASAVEFDQSFDQSFNFEELKRTASADGSRSNMQQSHESNDLEGRRPAGEGPKKKRVVKVKVIKTSSGGSPSDEQGVLEHGKSGKRKVVRKKVKPTQHNGNTADAESAPTKDKEQCPTATEPINERKKALHQMKAPKTPQTPSKVFVSKLYGSLSRFNNSENLNSDDGSLTEDGLIGANKQVTRSPAASLQPGMSPGASASGKRAFATSIGRYFSRNIRNPLISGSIGNGVDEGSISTNNSRGSRGSLGLFVGKKAHRAKHHLLGDDSSYDSGNLVKR